MRVVQLVDNLYLSENRVVVEMLNDIFSSQGINVSVCVNLYPDDLKFAVTNRTSIIGLEQNDVLILHTGTIPTFFLCDFIMPKCKKVLYYHGGLDPLTIMRDTPFFANECARANRQIRFLASKVDLAIASSDYNKELLVKYGYACPLYTSLPCMDFEHEPNASQSRAGVIEKNAALFSIAAYGKVDVNRRYEDLLSAFTFYQKAYNYNSKLTIIGEISGNSIYSCALIAYAEELGIHNFEIVDEGLAWEPIFDELDLFASFSESEDQMSGILLAVKKAIPIMAFRDPRLEALLGNAAMYFDTRDPCSIAKGIRSIEDDSCLREKLISAEVALQKELSWNAAYNRLNSIVSSFIRSIND